MSDPNGQVRKYDVVLASPSISAGVDLTFDTVEAMFPRLFGVFHGHALTHFELDQQLSRVRNPGKVEVWISDKTSAFEHTKDAIQGEVERLIGHALFLGLDDNGTEQHAISHPLTDIARSVVYSRHMSRRFLKTSFIEHKKSQGWVVEAVVDRGPAVSLRDLVIQVSKGSSLLGVPQAEATRAQAITKLLEAACLLREGTFSREWYSNDTLEDFRRTFTQGEFDYAEILKLKVDKLLPTSTARVVGVILTKVNIGTKDKSFKVSRKSIRKYKIDESTLA